MSKKTHKMTNGEAIKYLISPIATSTEPSAEYLKQKEAYDLAIKSLKERPQGEWIYDSDHSITIDMYKCSVCGCFGHTHFKFCQNCGADMKGGKE